MYYYMVLIIDLPSLNVVALVPLTVDLFVFEMLIEMAADVVPVFYVVSMVVSVQLSVAGEFVAVAVLAIARATDYH